MNDDRRLFVGNLVVNCSLSNSNALRPLSLSCHAHRILAHSHQYLSHAAHVRCQCEKRFKTSPHLSAMLNAHLLLTMWVWHTLDQTITSISYKRPASTSLIRNCPGQSWPVLCALRGLSLVTHTSLFWDLVTPYLIGYHLAWRPGISTIYFMWIQQCDCIENHWHWEWAVGRGWNTKYERLARLLHHFLGCKPGIRTHSYGDRSIDQVCSN